MRSRKHALAILMTFVLLLGAGGAYAFSTGGITFEGNVNVVTNLDVGIEKVLYLSSKNASYTWEPNNNLQNAGGNLEFTFSDSGYSHVRLRIKNHGTVPALLDTSFIVPEYRPTVLPPRQYLQSGMIGRYGEVHVGYYKVQQSINRIYNGRLLDSGHSLLEPGGHLLVNVRIYWFSNPLFFVEIRTADRECPNWGIFYGITIEEQSAIFEEISRRMPKLVNVEIPFSLPER